MPDTKTQFNQHNPVKTHQVMGAVPDSQHQQSEKPYNNRIDNKINR